MKKYWRSIEEKDDQPGSNDDEKMDESKKEFFEEMSNDLSSGTSVTRRDFLKVWGYSITAATLVASCESRVNKAIPFLIKPEEVISGIANYYASSYVDGNEYCSILVKTREGRPIKIEGNVKSGVTQGGTNARVQASILSLYDESERIKGPLHNNNKTTWENIDENVTPLLQSINAKNGKIVILSSTIISPSTKNVYKDFIKTYPNTRIIYYDAISASGILMANKNSFDQMVIPAYRFERADIIVSFGADFLGTWLSPIEFTRLYVQNRKLDGKKNMSRHIQFETGLSLTGSNADERFPIKPSEEEIMLVNLYNELLQISGNSTDIVSSSPNNIKRLANDLWSIRGKSLVLSGSNDVNIQILVNAINVLLENYGKTIDLSTPLYIKQGIDREMEDLVRDMEENKIDALIINNVNPAYDYPESDKFVNGLANLILSISFSGTIDETTSLVNYVCPDNHYLESWNDVEPRKGFFSLVQPTINPLFDTRASQESLLKWAGKDIGFFDYIQQHWENNIYPLQDEFTSKESGFKFFWIKSLQNGVFEINSPAAAEIHHKFNASVVQPAINELVSQKTDNADKIELQLVENIGVGNGKHANNPWLQELPDPISKVCWDNYVSVSPRHAAELGVENGDVVIVSSTLEQIELPVLLQPGQAYKTISIPLGYGRKNAGKVGNNIGKNAFRFCKIKDGNIQYKNDIKLIKTNKKHLLALTQTYNSMLGRPIVRETTLDQYIRNPSSGNEMHEKQQKGSVSLYKSPVHIGNHWGLSIDLNACTGCSACSIACQAENNIPVIGKEEVRKRRIMHWMRIDRYYSDSVDNPQVYHIPIMCQHCANAPCENVCPVAATMHSHDGLNHQSYNRCIGTRYCMSNCPYKVRRFNWYAYTEAEKMDSYLNSDYGRMVLNPDVIVRSRGVAEKCSLCIQRIQESETKAKLENRLLNEDEIKPACMQSCPANAILFGNLKNENSNIAKKFKDERNYHLLEEIHVLPSVGYLLKVRNQPYGRT
ncbi:MAG TPA: molybdopterin oxidoreductase [Marinilabiliales bacterium]|nr:molybdopterin oxidoreductase [Marinilabiliales bacterium]